MRAMLSGRLGAAAGTAAGASPGFDVAAVGRLLRPLTARGRFAVVGLVLGLAGPALLIARVAGGPSGPGGPAGPAVTFEGVGYQLLGLSVTKVIPQRGDRRLTASGTFEIVKLRLRAADGLPHRVSRDLVALHAGGTYYGVSAPEDLGLTDRQWGLMRAWTTVPAGGGVNVKAVFDVPSGVPRRHVSLHIGRFGYVGAAPARALPLPYRLARPAAEPARSLALPHRPAPAAPPQTAAVIRTLTPDPVLGGVVPQAEQTMPAATVALLASSINMKLPVRRLLL